MRHNASAHAVLSFSASDYGQAAKLTPSAQFSFMRRSIITVGITAETTAYTANVAVTVADESPVAGAGWSM